MLKNTSKKARENLRRYIIECVSYDEHTAETFKEVAELVKDYFTKTAYSSPYERKQNRQDAFIEWLGGLPWLLGDHYLRGEEDAIKILGDILEETEEERNRYDLEAAEKMLSRLIYREIFRN